MVLAMFVVMAIFALLVINCCYLGKHIRLVLPQNDIIEESEVLEVLGVSLCIGRLE